ncbi:glycosyltransferase [Sphingomonas sp. ZT3P38]|uniref:glycosyltransferase family 2 protein n=1 Tax=Parasphingomonas zepuensis TaxID=3096161 RepID=UPI002FC62961
MTTLCVIIPLFDKRAFIGDAIASLALQDMPPDQLIVVDDASTDGSAEAAERALAEHAGALRSTRVELLRRPGNGGPGAARNTGLDRADADLILCLDADDALGPDALRRIGEAMDMHALAMMVLGYASDPPGEIFPELPALADELTPLAGDVLLLADPLRAAAHPDFFMGRASNVVVRREWIAEHRYHADARLNEGIDLWYRVARSIVAGGGRVGLFAAPLIRFRVTSESLSHRPHRDWRTLEVPPTVRRYQDSSDPYDRAVARMLTDRWVDHALSILPDDQKALFLAHHQALLLQMSVIAA